MESSEAASVPQPAPIVTKNENSVTESKQEVKTEQIANGTVETKISSEKSVTVQSSVVTSSSGDQNNQQKR
jgi:hypothetical protein